eukprot:10765-Heterococcus_DN1.PRE.3
MLTSKQCDRTVVLATLYISCARPRCYSREKLLRSDHSSGYSTCEHTTIYAGLVARTRISSRQRRGLIYASVHLTRPPSPAASPATKYSAGYVVDVPFACHQNVDEAFAQQHSRQ